MMRCEVIYASRMIGCISHNKILLRPPLSPQHGGKLISPCLITFQFSKNSFEHRFIDIGNVQNPRYRQEFFRESDACLTTTK